MRLSPQRDRDPLTGADVDGDGPPSPYEPLAVETEYPTPERSIDPDPEKGWIRRMLPMLMARKGLSGLVLVGSLVSMAAKVAVPRVIMAAIDDGLRPPVTRSLTPFIWAVVGLGLV